MNDQYGKAREIAIEFIRVYVERGDSYEFLKSTWMGQWGWDYHASIGRAPLPGQAKARYGADTLRITRIGDLDCDYQFSLREIYDEIRTGAHQAMLPLGGAT